MKSATFCSTYNTVLEKKGHVRQLTMLVEDLARNVSAGKQTDFVLLDFSMAFGRVNHSKLLWKLHQYGIRSNALAWIRAFLGDQDRSLYHLVSRRDQFSDFVPCIHQ